MNLDRSDRARLVSLVQSQGYEVLLTLIEAECEKAETELLQTKPEETSKVLAMHNRAQAFRLLFERIQIAVQFSLHEEINPSDEISVEDYKELLWKH
jgi:hypothetical protein